MIEEFAKNPRAKPRKVWAIREFTTSLLESTKQQIISDMNGKPFEAGDGQFSGL
jgi:hypothetical protein